MATFNPAPNDDDFHADLDADLDDAFIALLRLRPKPLGRLVWLVAQGLCLVAALALIAVVLGVVGVVLAWLYRQGLHSPLRSPEDIEIVKEGAPAAARAALYGVAALAGASVPLIGLLIPAARTRAVRTDLAQPVPARKRLKRRLTRGERATRRRRWVRGWLAATVAAAIACAAVFDYAPWAPGSTVGGRIGDAILVALTIAVLFVAPMLVLGGLIGAVALPLYVHTLLRRGYATLCRLPVPAAESRRQRAPAARRKTADAPSSTVLVYLFADRFVEPRPRIATNAPVPCAAAAAVDIDELTATILAVAFWKLRDDGVLDLARGRAWRRLRRRHTVVARRVRVEYRPGLEGDIARFQTVDLSAYEDEDTSRDPGPIGDVRHVIRRQWFKRLYEDPHWQVVEATIAEARELGVISPCPTPGKPGHPTTHEVRCDRVAALEPAAEALAKRWRRFAATERKLHDVLVSECERAITDAVGREVQDSFMAYLGSAAQRYYAERHRDWPHDEAPRRPPTATEGRRGD